MRDVILLSYGINSKVFSNEEIGILHNYSGERVRQLQIKLLQDVKQLLEGGRIDNPKVKLKAEFCQIYRKVYQKLFKDKIHSLESIIYCLTEEFQESFNEDKKKTLELFLDTININKCGNVETTFTEARLYLTDSVLKNDFLKIALTSKEVLRKSIIPLSELEIIIQVRKKIKNAEIVLIKYALSLLPEIDSFESTEGLFYYQLKFDKLGNARDYAFRVLNETGKVMYIDEIVSEINSKLSNSNSHRLYDRNSLSLASDKRFIALQKTGYWGLKGWKDNTDRLEDLVKKALFKLNKPSSSNEIIEEVHKIRPQAKNKSLIILIGKNCLSLEGDLFILSEWRSRYTNLTFKPKRERISKEPKHHAETREKIIEILKLENTGKLRAVEIIKILNKNNSRISNKLVYKIFEDMKYFQKSLDASGKLFIELKQRLSPFRIAIDKYRWNDIKLSFKREIENVFTNPIQPQYLINFDMALDIFYDLVVYKTAESNLNGLEDRILPTLEKYFTKSNDRNDKLNYLKQLTTSLDAILKKILFLIDENQYRIIISNNKGLNAIITTLSKLDIYKNRHKRLYTEASDSFFGKYCYLAYTNRNKDTHNAKDWSETEIVEIINSCLVFYIYSIFEYSSEIKDKMLSI